MGFCGLHNRFKKQLGRTVTRMADDVGVRILDGFYHPLCIFFGSSRRVAQGMDTCDSQIQQVHVEFIQVERALRVEDIDFRPKQEFDAVHLPRYHVQVAEVNQVTASGNPRCMFCDAEHFQAFVGGCPCHFLQTTESMSAGNGVRMYI